MVKFAKEIVSLDAQCSNSFRTFKKINHCVALVQLDLFGANGYASVV